MYIVRPFEKQFIIKEAETSLYRTRKKNIPIIDLFHTTFICWHRPECDIPMQQIPPLSQQTLMLYSVVLQHTGLHVVFCHHKFSKARKVAESFVEKQNQRITSKRDGQRGVFILRIADEQMRENVFVLQYDKSPF